MMPPSGWQSNFQQGFRDVSQRFQNGASMFQQTMQQGFSGAQVGFQNAAYRASTAMRGYSQRFNFNQGGGFGQQNNFAQMSSGNPQFGVGGFAGGGLMMNQGGNNTAINDKQYSPNGYDNLDDDNRRCTRKTLIGCIVIFLILAAAGGGAGFLLSLNSARLAPGLGAANSGNETNIGNDNKNPLAVYNIQLRFLTSVTDGERQAFENAKARWEQVITADIPEEAILPKDRVFCGVTVKEDTKIDDLLIFVEIAPIDGPLKILGSGGPCGFDGKNFVRLGLMSFDSADSALLVANGQFADVVLHEMGHVLGLGTLWDTFGLITAPSTNLAAPVRYFGENGNLGNVEIGGPSSAVVENEGGQGTARGHWKDTVYQNELMTGFLSNGNNPMSRLTIRALADLGYSVDPNQADSFSFPGRRLRGTPEKKLHYGNDIKQFPRHNLPTRKKGSKDSFVVKAPEPFRYKANV